MNLEGSQWHQLRTEAPFHVRLWGDFAISAPDGCDATPRSRKSRALLAWMALHAGRPIARDRLCGLLWGDRGEGQARASLRQTLQELKSFTIAPAPLLLVTRQSITLDPARLQTDVDTIGAAQRDQVLLGQLLPDDDEIFLGSLDGIDCGFDDWLTIERTRQRDRLETFVAAASAQLAPQPLLHQPPPQHLPTPRTPAAALPVTLPVTFAAAAPRSPRALLALLIVALLGAGVFAGVASRFLSQPSETAPLAIAVLPFEDLSGTDKPYLAEGISEEILSRLAGNPRLKVLGRTSAASLRNNALDAREIGRRLGVAYLVEGSVRAAGADLRVVVALVRSEDGARLWSHRYDGKLADIFAIQDQIGDTVASRLRLPAGTRPETVLNAEAENYARYLQARTMLKDTNPGRVEPAMALLRQVLDADPEFAAAWAELAVGHALQADFTDVETVRIAARRDARMAATRALAINSKLARAHLILAYTDANWTKARPHLDAAVRLDPHDAETWYLLHKQALFEGNYPRALDMMRRAVAIDPLWWRAFYVASNLAWEMGYREEAEAYARRVEEGAQPRFDAILVGSDMAWRRGDFSTSFAIAQRAWLAAPPERRYFAELALSRALRAVGRFDQARPLWHRYPVDPVMMAMWNGTPPDAAATAGFIAKAQKTWRIDPIHYFLLGTLGSAQRTADIARLFDARFASPDAMLATLGPNADFMASATIVAAALRGEGRGREADRLLALATSAMQRMAARGPLPLQQLPSQAGLLAATGQRDAAIGMLQRAQARGFIYTAYPQSFRDMAQEPAFGAIREDPRFEAVRRANLAHMAREAHEIDAIALDPRLAARFAAAQRTN